MKLFVLGLLKCNRCLSLKPLKLNAINMNKITELPDINILKSKLDIFQANNWELLNYIYTSLGKDLLYDENDINEFLFGNDVLDGELLCQECNTSFPIENGIVDFYNQPNNKDITSI